MSPQILTPREGSARSLFLSTLPPGCHLLHTPFRRPLRAERAGPTRDAI